MYIYPSKYIYILYIYIYTYISFGVLALLVITDIQWKPLDNSVCGDQQLFINTHLHTYSKGSVCSVFGYNLLKIN